MLAMPWHPTSLVQLSMQLSSYFPRQNRIAFFIDSLDIGKKTATQYLVCHFQMVQAYCRCVAQTKRKASKNPHVPFHDWMGRSHTLRYKKVITILCSQVPKLLTLLTATSKSCIVSSNTCITLLPYEHGLLSRILNTSVSSDTINVPHILGALRTELLNDVCCTELAPGNELDKSVPTYSIAAATNVVSASPCLKSVHPISTMPLESNIRHLERSAVNTSLPSPCPSVSFDRTILPFILCSIPPR